MNPNINIRSLLQRLSRNLATIKVSVQIENSANDLSLNALLETRIMQIYNLLANLNLENANLFDSNYPGIDGIDNKNRVMAQVTSTFDNNKIEETIKKIIDRKLYESYDRLIFIFLKDKKKLTAKFQGKIQALIDNKFKFDFNTDIIDIDDIYRSHYYTQDFEKIHKTVGLLEEVLNYLPEYNIAGYDALSICFHEEELDNVYALVDTIIKEGYNVYISSKNLYDKFKVQNHPHHDLIILVYPSQVVSNITFCLTVISKTFINQLLGEASTPIDPLYTYALDNEIKMECISFDTHLKDYKKIKDRIKSYRSMPSDLIPVVQSILLDWKKESAYGNISIEEVKQELVNTHSNFTSKVLMKDSEFLLLNLKMINQGDIELNYMILHKDFVLGQVVDKLEKNFRKDALKNLNILVPKNFEQKTRRRLEAVKSAFGNQRVFYIDEHLFDKRLKAFKQSPILSTNEFISPVVRNKGELLRLNDIIHWILNNSDSSVAIINGSGGIGKNNIMSKDTRQYYRES